MAVLEYRNGAMIILVHRVGGMGGINLIKYFAPFSLTFLNQ